MLAQYRREGSRSRSRRWLVCLAARHRRVRRSVPPARSNYRRANNITLSLLVLVVASRTRARAAFVPRVGSARRSLARSLAATSTRRPRCLASRSAAGARLSARSPSCSRRRTRWSTCHASRATSRTTTPSTGASRVLSFCLSRPVRTRTNKTKQKQEEEKRKKKKKTKTVSRAPPLHLSQVRRRLVLLVTLPGDAARADTAGGVPRAAHP